MVFDENDNEDVPPMSIKKIILIVAGVVAILGTIIGLVIYNKRK